MLKKLLGVQRTLPNLALRSATSLHKRPRDNSILSRRLVTSSEVTGSTLASTSLEVPGYLQAPFQ